LTVEEVRLAMFFLRAIGLVRGSSVGAEEQNQEAPKDDNDAEQGSACTTFGLQRARMLRYCRQEKEKKNNGVHQVFYRFDPHRIANLPPKERPKRKWNLVRRIIAACVRMMPSLRTMVLGS
jgi:hypothetical protein